MTTLTLVQPPQDTPGTTAAEAARILFRRCPGLTGAILRARLGESIADVADELDKLIRCGGRPE